jgi:hypothetical protein
MSHFIPELISGQLFWWLRRSKRQRFFDVNGMVTLETSIFDAAARGR